MAEGGQGQEGAMTLGDYQVTSTRENLLGEGGFGKVYKGKKISTNEEVAIKVVIVTNKTREYVKNEVLIAITSKHKNVIRTLAVETDDIFHLTREPVFIVMELCPLGNLSTFFVQRNGCIPTGMCVCFSRDIAGGLGYLHSKFICHRDLKPENVLVTHDNGGYYVKVADMGLAKHFPQHSRPVTATAKIGTRGWWAPEVQPETGDAKYSISCDIFSLALIILSMLNHQAGQPLQHFTMGGVFLGEWMRCVSSVEAAASMPAIHKDGDDTLTSKLKECIREMLCFSPGSRLKIEVVCEKLQCFMVNEKTARCQQSVAAAAAAAGAAGGAAAGTGAAAGAAGAAAAAGAGGGRGPSTPMDQGEPRPDLTSAILPDSNDVMQ